MIDDYFHRQLQLLTEHPYVDNQSVRFDKRTEFVAFIRGDVYFHDGSRLHFRELVDVEVTLQVVVYSYHYQDADDTLLFRYDNTPHFPTLPNAPHHKHEGSETTVIAATQPNLMIVLQEVETFFMDKE